MSDSAATPKTGSHGKADPHLRRNLKARHLNMIAIGGAIGTGLFVASGGTITGAGPGGALLAYGAIGVMVFFLMQSLGEMATYCPSSGAFEVYATRYVSKSFGFAQGWNYWYNWAITVAAELVAATIVMQYWFPPDQVPPWIWSGVFLLILFTLNAFSVRGFGESEFWFAAIKVVTVLIFLALGVLMIVGILGGESPGLTNWQIGEAPFVNGFWGIMGVFMIAGFSFQGTEMIGIAAGETEDPEKNVPRATRAVFFRILLFYIGAILVIAFLIPYTDPSLLQGASADDSTAQGFTEAVTKSPFTLLFERAGIAGAAGVMNAVILTSILSAGNSGVYVATRMLYSMAKERKAPRLFGRVTSHGVPLAALAATCLIGAACFATSRVGSGVVYSWLVNASGLAGFITWMGIAWSHFCFRRAYKAQGKDPKDLPYRALLYPAGPLIALAMCAIVVVGQSLDVIAGEFSVIKFIGIYIGLFFFLAIWGGHKLVTRSCAVDPMNADLSRTAQ
ncbi:MAG: amino acid permease [Actinomyces sp.]|nr:amino acid permease [Actinomyces sp.]